MGENCFSKYGSVGQYLKLLYLENAPKAFVDLEPSYSTIIYSQYFVFSAPSRLQYIYIVYRGVRSMQEEALFIFFITFFA